MNSSDSFLFLPDISGFTDFVNKTEIAHSSHIIKELLELLIDAQELDLSLAEIEGDALFFYAHQQVPSAPRLFAQVKKMFRQFHQHLWQYEHQRICNCGACTTASQLSLKFIAHAGPLEFIQIKEQRKPFGKEVICAHRLMKNDVPSDEYLLISEGLLSAWKNTLPTPPDALPTASTSSTYDFGAMTYQYYQLDQWKENLELPPRQSPFFISDHPIKSTISVDLDAQSLYEVISNLKFRHFWQKDITDIQFDPDKINRAGQEHLCIINGQSFVIESLSTTNDKKHRAYGEQIKNPPEPFIKALTIFFHIDETSEEQSLLSIEIHLDFPRWVFGFLRRLIAKPMQEKLKGQLVQIKTFAESDAAREALV